jgi:hypothetical protein
MAAQIADEHIATFATESTWDGLADARNGAVAWDPHVTKD